MECFSADKEIIHYVYKSDAADSGENKRRRCASDEDGFCRLSGSDHQCHCRCGCTAFSKEHVRCVHCLNYISDNRRVCQCSFYVHTLTDDAICHMCHEEKYASFAAVDLLRPYQKERQVSQEIPQCFQDDEQVSQTAGHGRSGSRISKEKVLVQTRLPFVVRRDSMNF